MALSIKPSVNLGQLREFLEAASTAWKKQSRHEEALYVEAVAHLTKAFSHLVAAVKTEYTYDGQEIELYDIKCKKRGGEEDRAVKQMYMQWPKVAPTNLGGTCPFRRGMCIGRVGMEYFMSIGNIKFFYTNTEYLCGTQVKLVGDESGTEHKIGKVLLTEKANGEFTMCTSVRDENSVRWIVVGSKNVRLAVPYRGENTGSMMQAFDEIIRDAPESEMRFSYLKEMLQVWSTKLEHKTNSPERNPKLWSILERSTIVAEQVGVHSHIFDDYPNPDVLVFAVLFKSKLLFHSGCDVSELETTLKGSGLNCVKCEVFPLHGTKNGRDSLTKSTISELEERVNKLRDRLNEIASGPISVYGEGVVVCSIDEYGDTLEMFKFKNQEYAFDRRLRTLVANIIVRFPGAQGKSNKNTISSMLGLRNAIDSLKRSLQTSLDSAQFSALTKEFGQDRIEQVPYLMLLLFQQPYLCSNFSDLFTSLMAQARAIRLGTTEQPELVEWFQSRIELLGKLNEPLHQVSVDFAKRNQSVLDTNREALRTVNDLALEVADVIHKQRNTIKMVGFSAPPGSGKSTLLQQIRLVLETKYNIPANVFDRDQYVMKSSNPREVSEEWHNDIKRSVKQNEVALVGNCLDGDFAEEMEKVIGVKMLLVVPSEIPHRHKLQRRRRKKKPLTLTDKDVVSDPCDEKTALFMCYCIERLLSRDSMLVPDAELHNSSTDEANLDGVVEDEDDLLTKSPKLNWKLGATGSTLTMELGATVVLNKFFSTGPFHGMIEQRAKSGSLHMLSMFHSDKPIETDSTLMEQLVKLKHIVFEPPKCDDQDDSLPGTTPSTFRTSPSIVPLQLVDSDDKISQLLQESEIMYSSVTALESSRRLMMAWVSPVPQMNHQDGHITVKYRPANNDVIDLATRIRQEGSYMVDLPLVARVTVRRGKATGSTKAENKSVECLAAEFDVLQFLLVDLCDPKSNTWMKLFKNDVLHVTLATTNVDRLPPGASRQVTEEIIRLYGVENSGKLRSDVAMKIPKSTDGPKFDVSVDVEPLTILKREGISAATRFVGHVSLVHRPRAKRSSNFDFEDGKKASSELGEKQTRETNNQNDMIQKVDNQGGATSLQGTQSEVATLQSNRIEPATLQGTQSEVAFLQGTQSEPATVQSNHTNQDHLNENAQRSNQSKRSRKSRRKKKASKADIAATMPV